MNSPFITLFQKIFLFLASIRFAIILITLSAIIVAAGTILESRTESHLYAAQWTYHHPIFQWLLAFFFVNILFSAIRRWPFKVKHIPFLMTHCGLLMIIAGTMIKNQYGLQGHLFIWEGGGNSYLIIPHTYALNIEKRSSHLNDAKEESLPLSTFFNAIYYSRAFPSLKCQIIASDPHVEEKFDHWIKQDKTSLLGFPSIPIRVWQRGDPLPPFIYTSIYGRREEKCGLICLQVDDLPAAIEAIYSHQLSMHITFTDPQKSSIDIPWINSTTGENGILSTLSIQIEKEKFDSTLTLKIDNREIHLPLSGVNALSPSLYSFPWMPVKEKIKLTRPSLLFCILRDKEDAVWLITFDRFGRISVKNFSPTHLQQIIVYDQGYGGYTIQTELLAPTFPANLNEVEFAKKQLLKAKLKFAIESDQALVPPLELLKQAAIQADTSFIDILIEFLYKWHSEANLLFTPNHSLPNRLEKTLAFIKWDDLPHNTLNSLMWISYFLKQIQCTLEKGIDLEDELKRSQWPFMDYFQKEKMQRHLPSLLSQQISSLSTSLPQLPFPQALSSSEHSTLLSAYMLLFDITFTSLTSDESEEQLWRYFLHAHPENHQSHLTLESLLTNRLKREKQPDKLEEARPGLVIDFYEENKEQRQVLAYDPTLDKIKWPIFGEYTVAFQPILRKIPYRIRLRQARSITYPNSSQIYSYESDLIITEQGKEPIEQTISMNRVYETWDGYRFYLAGISPDSQQNPKRIQIVVNYDPSKYYLTYPGAALVFLGAILLFWYQPYRKKGGYRDS